MVGALSNSAGEAHRHLATNIRLVLGRRRLRKRTAKPSLLELTGKTGIAAIPYAGGALNQIINGLQQRRRYEAETALGAISERVGQDVFLTIVAGNPEIEAMLWIALQAITMTGVESKRRVLQNVVANAMVSEEPIDIEQLKVTALAELDAPHIRALERLSQAQWFDAQHSPSPRGEDGKDHSALAYAANREPTPVLAALIRTGVVYPGGAVDTGQGVSYAPVAGELTVGGVTEFVDDLLDDLRAEDPDGAASRPGDQERAAHRAFMKELRSKFDGEAAK